MHLGTSVKNSWVINYGLSYRLKSAKKSRYIGRCGILEVVYWKMAVNSDVHFTHDFSYEKANEFTNA